ncbi:MAG: aminomethyl-transferring glycine dehydrogenase subunit GcvPB [Bacteriovoracaceae bacterium]|nr:aminomethyl-transferring glycine dehydrogenase subunit GcvPB [Bacteriovoracaceae bacterium]
MTSINPRENYPFYVGITKEDEKLMLESLGLNSLEDLFKHIGSQHIMPGLDVPKHKEAPELREHIEKIASKNKKVINFIGDGLQEISIPSIVPMVCSIRGLTTAYTPYQPERSQGTLQTLWIYQSVISEITGFEAVNASLYERSTCLHEALNCSLKMARGKDTVIVAESIYPGDKEVIDTLIKETDLKVIYAPIDKKTSRLDKSKLEEIIKSTESIAALAIPQINCFGQIEDFDALTDLAHDNKLLAIAIIDPIALANDGLKEPSSWGSKKEGADILVGEGQHLALSMNFGGPGLGIFGVRHNDRIKNGLRASAGRFIGKTVDEFGKECKSIILSTREQHIRREKATSNICSNQSFIASAAGASIFARGDKGLNEVFKKASDNARLAAQELSKFEGVKLKFNNEFFNEIVLELDFDVQQLIKDASEAGIHIGVNISGRCGVDGNLLLMSFSDKRTPQEMTQLFRFFKERYKRESISSPMADLKPHQKRINKASIPTFETSELYEYYQKLGKQNLSPDEGLYPLGSCTMKYNPEINDWAASLEEFTETHPQAPEADVQGNLEILFHAQEWFKKITGLPGVTTQPVAGAQGELVGLKMFQAYHRDRGEAEKRNIVVIPKSAHGTNPATATMAGYETKKIKGEVFGIVTLDALPTGEMDFEKLKEIVSQYSDRLAAVMVTNPNTAGIFETKLKQMSDLVHEAGGLVYMDGANMNAIAGWVDLDTLGVDAVHNNLHKTWSIPHGGGGPGDAIVAVSEKLIDYLPGVQIKEENGVYSTFRTPKSIGSFHRHFGNFAHKVRAYTYLAALGSEGIKRMSAIATLSARYLYQDLKQVYPILPVGSEDSPRMHEFILTLSQEMFEKIEKAGTPKAQAIAKVGKLFLDFGFHAPTVAFPEQYGLMIEPTESYTKAELDQFAEVVKSIHRIIHEYPQILTTAPHFTPVGKVDELSANKQPVLSEALSSVLPEVAADKIDAAVLRNMNSQEIQEQILKAHESKTTQV